jgi:hypothetical protein
VLGRRVFAVIAIRAGRRLRMLLTWLPGVVAGEPVVEFVPWIPQLDIAFSFRIDALALLLALIVTGVGALVLAALQRVTVFVASIAAAVGALAQEPAFPAGHWEAVSSETYPPHSTQSSRAPSSTSRSMCRTTAASAANGASTIVRASPRVPSASVTFPCRFSGTSAPVSGRFGRGGQGMIDLGRLGRSALSWTAPAAGELALDLPKDWRGDAVLWRARLTRDGKGKPRARRHQVTRGPLLSANALYREFNKDSNAALRRHAGTTLVLEGRRGTLIELSDGGAAIHIADGFTSRALVLSSGICARSAASAKARSFAFGAPWRASTICTSTWKAARSSAESDVVSPTPSRRSSLREEVQRGASEGGSKLRRTSPLDALGIDCHPCDHRTGLARRTGRFPQLVDPRSSANGLFLSRFVKVSRGESRRSTQP